MPQSSRLTEWAILAAALAAIGTIGSLDLSVGMGLKASPLCFCQRTFVMSVLAVLVLSWGCVASAPPMPPAPDNPYDKPLDICRPPFHR